MSLIRSHFDTCQGGWVGRWLVVWFIFFLDKDELCVNFVGVFHPVKKAQGKNEWVHQKAGEILYKIHASHIPLENLSYASKIDLKV